MKGEFEIERAYERGDIRREIMEAIGRRLRSTRITVAPLRKGEGADRFVGAIYGIPPGYRFGWGLART